MANHFNILTWKIPVRVQGSAKGLTWVTGSDMTDHSTAPIIILYLSSTFRFMLTREIAQSVRMDAINGCIVQRRKVRHRDVK